MQLTSSESPNANSHHLGSRYLELGERSDAERTRLARRDVVVAVGGRPITLVEDIFHVQLDAPHLVDLSIDGSIEADETRQSHTVVRRGERIRKIDHAERCRPCRIDL